MIKILSANFVFLKLENLCVLLCIIESLEHHNISETVIQNRNRKKYYVRKLTQYHTIIKKIANRLYNLHLEFSSDFNVVQFQDGRFIDNSFGFCRYGINSPLHRFYLSEFLFMLPDNYIIFFGNINVQIHCFLVRCTCTYVCFFD